VTNYWPVHLRRIGLRPCPRSHRSLNCFRTVSSPDTTAELSIFEGHPKMLTKTEPKRPTIAIGGLFGFILLLPLKLIAAALHRESRKRFDARPLLFPTVRGRLRSRCNAAEGEEANGVGAYFRRKLLIRRSDLFRPTLIFFSRLSLFVLIYGFPLSSVLGQDCTTPKSCGQWSPVQNWPVEAIHATLLKTGRVLMWPGPRTTKGPIQTYLWDPAVVPPGSAPSPTPFPVQQCGDNVFCGGHALLSDGKLLVTGGHNAASYKGLKATNVYDPANGGSWTKLSDMNDGRWYPTTTALPNGDALVISGQVSNSPLKYNDLPQIWQSGSGLSSWRSLSTARMGLPYYPYMFVAPSGKIFMAGPWQQARYLINITGNGGWDPPAGVAKDSLKSHLATRNWGSAVMYQPGKVLMMGGTTCGWYPGTSCSSSPTPTAEFIDLTISSPQWTLTGNMLTGGRRLHNATLLPDGNVFVTGGSRGTEDPNNAPTNPPTDYALDCEMWNPPPAGSGKGQWSKKAKLQVFRAYHSVALLLPDGRVLSAGGDKAKTPTGVGAARSAELYSPPYLFDANNSAIPASSRPVISPVSPSSISYTSSFTINFSNASSISKVTLVALGSVTHGFNMGQRFVSLSFTSGSGTLTVPSQLDRYKAPPGYYMLFILNGSGVPSVAKIIQLH
jgi:hypothetical protein